MITIETALARPPCRRLVPTFTLAWLLIQPALAQQQPAPEPLEYKGTVAAARQAEVAPRIDGLLLKINFTAGQIVKKGDLLFEFGASEKELTLTAAKANRDQAEAQLRLTEVSLKNAQTLRARNAASQMRLLETEAQRDIAAAR